MSTPLKVTLWLCLFTAIGALGWWAWTRKPKTAPKPMEGDGPGSTKDNGETIAAERIERQPATKLASTARKVTEIHL